jgi:hypothetical protein
MLRSLRVIAFVAMFADLYATFIAAFGNNLPLCAVIDAERLVKVDVCTQRKE